MTFYNVSSGQVLSNITLVSGDNINVTGGGIISAITVDSGAFIGNSAGGLEYGTVLSGGNENVAFGGYASGVQVRSGGDQQVGVGGSAFRTTISSGGSMEVSAGGIATSTTVDAGGQFNVDSQGSAVGAVLSNGAFVFVSSGATMTSTVVDSGALMLVMPGANVTGTVSAGGIIISSGAGVLGSAGLTSGTIIANSSIPSGAVLGVFPGGSAVNDILYGSAFVFSGGVTTGVSVASGAQLEALNGAILHADQVLAGGLEGLTAGAVANSTTIGSGGMEALMSGATANGDIVQAGGALVVMPGATATGTINSGGAVVSSGVLEISGATIISSAPHSINGITVGDYESMLILPGGSASALQINGANDYNSGATVNVYSGGLLSSASVFNQGTINVYAGGSAVSDQIGSNGTENVSSGGVASGENVSSNGTLNVSQGGLATGAYVVSNGQLNVSSGGSATSGEIGSNAGMNVVSGGVASGMLVSGGYVNVYSSGILSATSVTAQGNLNIYTGGSATGVTVGSGGNLTVSGGAISNVILLSGGALDLAKLTFVSGATVASINSSTDVLTVSAGGATSTYQLSGSTAGEIFSTNIDGGGGTVVTATSAQPSISGTVGNQAVWDDSSLSPFSGVVINDSVGQTETVTVTPSSNANGAFSNLGSGSVNSSTGAFTVIGTPGAVTAALEALVFTPTAAEVNPGQQVATTFTIGVTDSASATASNSNTSVLATAASTAIGAGVDLMGVAETDYFYLAGNGQLGFSYSATFGGPTSYVRITNGASPFEPGVGTTALGTGLNLFRVGGHDIFLLSASGAVSAEEINSSGQILAGATLMNGASPFTVAAGGSVIGTGYNLWGDGGVDVFTRTSTNQMTAAEFNSSGVEIAFNALTAQGNPFYLDAVSTVIGSGLNFWGTGYPDIFVRTGTGQIQGWEFNGSGVAQVAHPLTAQGNPFIVDNATTVVGTGFDFWGSGNADMFLRGASGNISAWEFNYVGVATVGQNLMVNSTNTFVLDAASTIVGTGLDFLGTTYEDIYVRSVTGQLSVDEFNPNAIETASASLSVGGSALIIDGGTEVIGSGVNLLDTGNHDLFLRNTAGQISALEFNSSGVEVAQTALMNGASQLTLAGGSTVIGTGFDLLGTGNNDIFVRTPVTNAITAYEYATNGALLGSAVLTVGASPFQLDGSSTVIGSGYNYFGSGNHDIFVRTSTDQIDAWEYTTAGVAVQGQQLMVGSNPFLLDGGSAIIGAGYDFFGTGNHDIFVRTNTGQIDVWEFTAAGVATVSAQLTVGGYPYLLDSGSTIVGSGNNFWGTGGSDIFIRSAAGDMSVWEFNSAGQVTEANTLLSTFFGTGFALDGTTQVIGGSGGIYASGDVDLYAVTGSGQLSVYEFNTAVSIYANAIGELQYSTTFTLSGGGSFIVPQTDTVAGAGADGATSALDVILQTATGQTTVYDISGTAVTAQSGVIATTQSNNSVVTVGTSGANTLTAGSAATTLIGNGGSDIYDLASNFSQTTIMNGVSGGSASGNLVFLSPSVGVNNLWFDQVNDLGAVSSTGNNLRIDVLGTNQSVTIDGWFSVGGIHQALAEIEVSGAAQFVDSGLNALVSAMSAYEASHPSFNPATAASTITDSSVLSAVNAAWHS